MYFHLYLKALNIYLLNLDCLKIYIDEHTHTILKKWLGFYGVSLKGIFIGSLLSDRKFQMSVYVGTFIGVVSPKTRSPFSTLSHRSSTLGILD